MDLVTINIISMNMCNEICNTVEDPFGRICVYNKIEDKIPKVYKMIKGIIESNALTKHILLECRYEFYGEKCHSKQNRINDNCQCECKKQQHIADVNMCTFGILVNAIVIKIMILLPMI